MQVYGVLDVLTARPGKAELAAAPHRLYGHVDPGQPYSAGRWLDDIETLAAAGTLDRHRPIFVGGTGLYFRALTEGLSDMPAVPAAIRALWRGRLAEEGAAALHRILAERDAMAAGRLRPTDSQRIVRALEVLDASGRSIVEWQARKGTPLVEADSAMQLVLDVDRALLGPRIDRRFERMMVDGALDEVAALTALVLDPKLPAMKAIGVRELQSVIANERTLEQAAERAKAATRQYAKRQATWFRSQLGPEWLRVAPSEEIGAAALARRLAGG